MSKEILDHFENDQPPKPTLLDKLLDSFLGDEFTVPTGLSVILSITGFTVFLTTGSSTS